MSYIPGLVPGPIRRPAEHIPPPTYNGMRYFEVRYWRSKGRATPDPPEDPDAFPNRVAACPLFGPLVAQQLIDGDYGAETGPYTHSHVRGGARDQYANRMAHLKAREQYLSAKVDLGDPIEEEAHCYTGGGGVHVYKRHPYEDTWELDYMYNLNDPVR